MDMESKNRRIRRSIKRIYLKADHQYARDLKKQFSIHLLTILVTKFKQILTDFDYSKNFTGVPWTINLWTLWKKPNKPTLLETSRVII